ncbi:hypothetical protein D9M68_986490 [compost metagenome]
MHVALEVRGVLQRAGADTRGQAVGAGIGQLQGVLVVVGGNGAGDRPEDFFLGDAHLRLGVDEQRRAHEVALGLALQRPTTPG